MNVLIVDDEPLARERLAALLADFDEVVVVGEAGNGRDAIEAVSRLRPDVVLMDIRMPLMDGLEAARHLGTLEAAPGVIFCTAYEEHALAAFEANAVDYLVKPVRSERLRAALTKARRWSGEQARSIESALEPGRKRTHLCARVRGSLVLVPVAEINYLLAEDKYVVVHHAKGEVLIEEPLKTLEDEFEGRFVRIHRNCLVALAKLVGLTRSPDGRLFANVDGISAELEVSRRNLPLLRKLVRTL
jgi:two-component system response regulator AlgR